MNHERDQLLPIGGFAAASQLSPKALRLYAQLQLLEPAYVDPESGYRYYHAAQLGRARLILLLRQIEMPLATIRLVLAAAPAEAERMVRAHLRSLEQRLGRAQRTVPELLRQLHKEAKPMSLDVTIRETPAQPILAISRQVTIDGLGAHIQGSLAQIQAAAHAQGLEPAGPPFGIYHGPVNQESDGPMEVCLPVRTPGTAAGAISARSLEAARLACVTMRGKQCDFPAVLQGYDLIYAWIEQNGYQMAGSPREIWLSEPGAAGTPDEAMEIAWPFCER